jgi:hypothetical protein
MAMKDEEKKAPPHGAPDEPERRPGVPPHQPAFNPDEDDLIDEELEESFPSSDPPSHGSPGL